MNLACVILAAGLGKRMKSRLPKVLHKVCGVPMLQAVINAAKRLKPERIVIVAGEKMELMKEKVEGSGLQFALQEEAKGTAHALRCARPFLKNFKGVVVVLNGDTPLLGPGTIKRFLDLHKRYGNAISVLSFRAKNPEDYGRIVRDASKRVLAIVEHNDAEDSLRESVDEVNSGVYAINHDALALLDGIRMNSSKGEYYLTDIVVEASKKGLKAAAYCLGTEEEFIGVNTREELYRASMMMRKAIVDKWMKRGVDFLDISAVFIHPDVSIGKETTIYPNVYIEGRTKIGRGSTIYPNVRILNSEIGSGVVIKDSTIIEESRIEDGASIGPFARIRPGSEVGKGARIGNFVELKKAVIGRGSKASHLSYIGDATVGKAVNIGAGTITCNYDGREKHRTEIEDEVFVGSDTQFVAPVRVGRGAYIGSGSTITRDVPPLSLSLSRVEQRNIEGWVSKKFKVKSSKLKVKKEERTMSSFPRRRESRRRPRESGQP